MIIKTNLELTEYNSYRIFAIAKHVFFPQNEEELVDIIRKLGSEFILIGGGNNIIFSKNYYDTPVIIIKKNFSHVYANNNIIYAQAGCNLKTLSEIALKKNLSGLEIFWDIPGTLGGAIFMNAGAYGVEIKDIVTTVQYYDVNNDKVFTIENTPNIWQYRRSIFQNGNKIILNSKLLLLPEEGITIKNKMLEILEKRNISQPKEYPNAGSVFKRPQNFFVGKLVSELGLKGLRVGGAQISVKHGGFIINLGSATGKDVIKLIELIRVQVLKSYGIELEIEQRII